MLNHQVNIRLAELSDAIEIRDIYAPFIQHTTTSFEFEVPSTEEFEERIRKTLEQEPWLVCMIDDAVAGYAYSSEHRSRRAYQWTREVSVYVHPDYHQRRVATALYTSLIALLKLQGFTNLLAGITLPNPASVNFHTRLGFEPIGVYHNIGFKLGKYCDVGWWEMFIGHKNQGPGKIKSLKEVQQTEEWTMIIQHGVNLVQQ